MTPLYFIIVFGIALCFYLGIKHRSWKMATFGAMCFAILGAFSHYIDGYGDDLKRKYEASVQECVNAGNQWIEGRCYERG